MCVIVIIFSNRLDSARAGSFFVKKAREKETTKSGSITAKPVGLPQIVSGTDSHLVVKVLCYPPSFSAYVLHYITYCTVYTCEIVVWKHTNCIRD